MAWLRSLPVPAWPPLVLFLCVCAGVLDLRPTFAKVLTAVLIALCLWVTRRQVRDGRLLRWLAALPADPRGFVLLLSLATFAIRAAWVLAVQTPPTSDFREYMDLGDHLCRTGTFGLEGPSAYRPVGYPALLAVLSCAGLPVPLAGGLVNALLAGLSVWPLFALAQNFAGDRAARMATVLFALWPSQILGASLLATETPTSFLTLWLTWTLWHAWNHARPWRWLVLAGVLLALTTYVRAQTLGLGALLVAMAALHPERLRRVPQMVAVLGVALTLLVPWGLRNERVLGVFTLSTTNGGPALVYGAFDGAFARETTLPFTVPGDTELARNAHGYALSLQWFRAHPVGTVALVPFKWKYVFGDDIDEAGWAVLGTPWNAALEEPLKAACDVFYVWFACALWWTIRRRPHLFVGPLAWLLTAPWWALLAVHAVWPGQTRYHAPLVAVFAIMAAAGLSGEPENSERAPT